MSSSTLDVYRPSTSTQGTSFMDLPSEVRFQIYELVLYAGYFDDESGIEDDVVKIKRLAPKAQILLTCKKIYEEASPIVYRKMVVGHHPEMWYRFLKEIGPRNISRVRDLTLWYNCSLDGDRWTDCIGRYREDEYFDRWANILNPFKIAQTQLNLKNLTVLVFPCDGTGCPDLSKFRQDYTPFSRYWYEHDGAQSSENTYVEPVFHMSCRVYQDELLFKHLSCFTEVMDINIKGFFDPDWLNILRQVLGFTVKIDFRPGQDYMSDVTLTNPNHPHYDVNLRGYEPVQAVEGFYERVVEELEELEEPEEPEGQEGGNDE